ncbi:N-alpha-acetyltransferase 80 [Amyelois transitella]|uniref:N-alpha-acetyltransferase 80 n=1 Tax=Amyelois transitella TaxID=680683 RepID=UPI00067AE699|nr:N-alpha-acetyltransferase 80 [Amyelois transitella]
MNFNSLSILPLHHYPEYLKPCCDLINAEWPRSETARMMSLQASCDSLPTSFILVNDKCVIGHCKLTPIPSIPESCFIETVVISKSLRGKKLGSFLMNKMEDYGRDVLKLKMMHLSTKGQENFYAKLGYELCPPVSIYGTCVNSMFKKSEEESSETVKYVPQNAETSGFAPPPPPPPMPKAPDINGSNQKNCIKSTKTFMFKYL